MKHLVLSDCQVKPGVDISYLTAVGNYLVEKKPDKIICLGDFADMPSLSSYDYGKKAHEGRRYVEDVECARIANGLLWKPLEDYNLRQRRSGHKQYLPEKHIMYGNHEDRITRAANSDPKMEGTISLEDLGYSDYYNYVYPFLEVNVIDNIAYSHYFTSGVMGRPVANARLLALKKHMSCTMGHVQNWDMHRDVKADGKPIIALFAGSSYTHNEDYLGPQGNTYDRGIWMKHEVDDGHYFPMFVSLNYLAKEYA